MNDVSGVLLMKLYKWLTQTRTFIHIQSLGENVMDPIGGECFFFKFSKSNIFNCI